MTWCEPQFKLHLILESFQDPIHTILRKPLWARFSITCNSSVNMPKSPCWNWCWDPWLHCGWHRTGTGLCLQKELTNWQQKRRKTRQDLNTTRAMVLSLIACSYIHLLTFKNTSEEARAKNHGLQFKSNLRISHFLLTGMESCSTLDHGLMWAQVQILKILLLLSLHKTFKLSK